MDKAISDKNHEIKFKTKINKINFFLFGNECNKIKLEKNKKQEERKTYTESEHES